MRYNSLTELEADNKKPNPHRKSPFCGLIADILFADTYIITALAVFVKVKAHTFREEVYTFDVARTPGECRSNPGTGQQETEC